MWESGYTSCEWLVEYAVGLSRLGGEGHEMQVGGGTARDARAMGVAEGVLEEEDVRLVVSESSPAAG